jgi:ubiquinone/menaquinone biosynthesis C-methylase UbiE
VALEELAIPLAKHFKNVLGLDPDLEMIKEARKKTTSLRNYQYYLQ